MREREHVLEHGPLLIYRFPCIQEIAFARAFLSTLLRSCSPGLAGSLASCLHTDGNRPRAPHVERTTHTETLTVELLTWAGVDTVQVCDAGVRFALLQG
jgi:hypothetical protein